MEMADSKPEESKLGKSQIAQITTKTSMFSTLYFCNVAGLSTTTFTDSFVGDLSTSLKPGRENRHPTQRPMQRDLP